MSDVRFPFELRIVWPGIPQVTLTVIHQNRPVVADELRALVTLVEDIEHVRDLVQGMEV